MGPVISSGLFSAAEYTMAALSGLGLVIVGTILTWRTARAMRALLRVGRTRTWPALLGAVRRRTLEELPLVTTRAGLAEGARVRIRGVVVDEDRTAIRAPLSGARAVICQHAFGDRGGGTLGEGLVARDFVVELEDGETVRVSAEAAAGAHRLALVDEGRHAWAGVARVGGWFSESRVEPGTTVEVHGRLERAFDRNAPRLGDRQAPLRFTFAAGDGRLVVRFATVEQTPVRRRGLPASWSPAEQDA